MKEILKEFTETTLFSVAWFLKGFSFD